jgi:hypothetical protein
MPVLCFRIQTGGEKKSEESPVCIWFLSVHRRSRVEQARGIWSKSDRDERGIVQDWQTSSALDSTASPGGDPGAPRDRVEFSLCSKLTARVERESTDGRKAQAPA